MKHYKIIILLVCLYSVTCSGSNTCNILFTEDLRGKNFQGADLKGVDLSDKDLTDVDFAGANLVGANLTNTKLGGVNFSHADLRGVKFENANLNDKTPPDNVGFLNITNFNKAIVDDQYAKYLKRQGFSGFIVR